MTSLVGILNVTPDSFSDGGQFNEPAAALQQAERLLAAGAELLDVGAESTRPQATVLSPDQEWRRLEPVLPGLLARYPGKLSIDSYHPETFRRAFALGPVIINDVTGLSNLAMLALVVALQATVIICHLPGSDVQAAHRHPTVATVEQIKIELLAKANALESQGLPRTHIILDPGIGFGKTAALNWELLKFAAVVPDYDVMIGYSRKRFLGEQRMELAPNVAAGRIAVANGARYLRVHDVAGHARQLSL